MSELIELDSQLFLTINGMGREWLDGVFIGLSELGAWTIVIVALAFLACEGRRSLARHGLALLLVALPGTMINSSLKSAVHRVRPAVKFERQIAAGEVTIRVLEQKAPKRRSFPSGHSMLAFYCMSYIAFWRKSHRVWALSLAAMVALARVYVGVHFPLDCLAGAMLGTGGGWASWKLKEWIERRYPTGECTA